MLGIDTAPFEAPSPTSRRLVSNFPAPEKLARPAEPKSEASDAFGGRKMIPELLRELTNTEPGCYEAPHLNEKLYLNRKGFRVIENLEPYTNVVGLFLDSNGIHQIQNIGHMTNLRMLYLDNNCITKIEGLETLLELHTLNLSGNNLVRVEGLQGLTKLESLYLSKNNIQSLADMEGIREAPEVSSLDVSFNQIEDQENVATTIATLVPKLKCLSFNNNPNKRFLQNYRRDFISKIPTLTFLDDRKVDDLERKTSEAWGRGLTRKEVEATRVAHIEEKRAAHRASVEALKQVQAERIAEVARLRAAAENGEEAPSENVDINAQRPLGSTATPRVTVQTAISEDVTRDAEIAAPLQEMWYGKPKKEPSAESPAAAPAAEPAAEPAEAPAAQAAGAPAAVVPSGYTKMDIADEDDTDDEPPSIPRFPAKPPAGSAAAPPPAVVPPAVVPPAVPAAGYPSVGAKAPASPPAAPPVAGWTTLSELDMLD